MVLAITKTVTFKLEICQHYSFVSTVLFLRISSLTNIVRTTLQFSNESAEDLSLLILTVQMTPLLPEILRLQLSHFSYISELFYLHFGTELLKLSRKDSLHLDKMAIYS